MRSPRRNRTGDPPRPWSRNSLRRQARAEPWLHRVRRPLPIPIPLAPDLGVTPGQPNRRTLNQRRKVRMLASWGHLRGPEPALSSMNGSERRKRELDSLRTLSPILVALPVPCDTASLAGGRVPMSSRSEVHRCIWWSRHERQPAELQALRGPFADVRAARRVLREHQGLRCAEAAWENGGGTGEHGGRRELADSRRTAARHVDKAVEKPGMGRSRGSRKVHSPPWWVTRRGGGLPAGH